MVEDMNISNTKTVGYWEENKVVVEVLQKSTAGGDGYFGIALIVFVFVMNREISQIDISICDL